MVTATGTDLQACLDSASNCILDLLRRLCVDNEGRDSGAAEVVGSCLDGPVSASRINEGDVEALEGPNGGSFAGIGCSFCCDARKFMDKIFLQLHCHTVGGAAGEVGRWRRTAGVDVAEIVSQLIDGDIVVSSLEVKIVDLDC